MSESAMRSAALEGLRVLRRLAKEEVFIFVFFVIVVDVGFDGIVGCVG
jgi:hypothetical protein